jgi:hypothetical protein
MPEYLSPVTTTNAIWLRPLYFRLSSRDRGLTLIHEHVHIVRTSGNDPHPGGVRVNFGATSLDIPYAKALNNPYCYQYYADWIDDPTVTGNEF